MSVKRLLLAFAVTLALTSAVIVPLSLARHHHASQKLRVQIGATALVDLGLATVIWLFLVAVMAIAQRAGSSGGEGGDPPARTAVGQEAGGAGSRTHAEASFGEPR